MCNQTVTINNSMLWRWIGRRKEKDRQTDRQTDMTDRQVDKPVERDRAKETERMRKRE